MITFYIIGVAITLLFFLSFLVWLFVNKKVDKLDVIGNIPITVLLSSLSWVVIFVIGMMYIFEMVKENKNEKK